MDEVASTACRGPDKIAYVSLYVCPFWVTSRHSRRKRSCPLYPRKRTCAVQL